MIFNQGKDATLEPAYFARVQNSSGSGGSGDTGNYEDLINLPMFNGVRIIGDKSDEDYGIIGITNAELEKILK